MRGVGRKRVRGNYASDKCGGRVTRDEFAEFWVREKLAGDQGNSNLIEAPLRTACASRCGLPQRTGNSSRPDPARSRCDYAIDGATIANAGRRNQLSLKEPRSGARGGVTLDPSCNESAIRDVDGLLLS